MARRRVETTEEPKPSAAEIKKVQDDAVSRAIAKRDLEKRAESDETGAVSAKELQEYQKDLADEREAIQAEGNPVADLLKGTQESLGKGFFGTSAEPPSPVVKEAIAEKRAVDNLPAHASTRFTPPTGPATLGEEGLEVHYTKGEEMYGKPGQFSTYRVGPFSSSTTVRPGETRVDALRRLSKEMNEFFDEERERAKQAFLSHYPKAFT